MNFFNQIKANDSIVILTGAGISAESGLATFRGDDGLWEGHRVEDVATPEAFERDPALVHEFYNMRRAKLFEPDIQPNAAHKTLAKLQEKWSGDLLLVTQNIDDLHERGGNKEVMHMHGEVLKVFCLHCSHPFGRKIEWENDLDTDSTCPDCGQEGGLRPDIVWFGEMPYFMDEIYKELSECNLFLSIGTSGNVYPAAGFVNQALHAGALCAEVNLEPSLNAGTFHEGLYGPATTCVPELVDNLLAIS